MGHAIPYTGDLDGFLIAGMLVDFKEWYSEGKNHLA